ncbi:hypothetical protein D3C86_1090960 [compost metagenome]
MLRSYSRSTFWPKALALPKWSTMTEWSMTRSTGTSGLILAASAPSLAMASRIAARSTTAGTPVKSCIRTRAGRKAISCSTAPLFSIQAATAFRSSSVTETPSSLRSRFSRSTFIERGRREIPARPASSAAGRL